MNKPTITVIGAASTTFGPKVLRDILNHPEVAGCTFRFVDVDAERLEIYLRLAQRVSALLSEPVTVEATTDRRQALRGSDYVILSVDTGHYTTWEQDFAVPAAHGSRQVLGAGDAAGPGGRLRRRRRADPRRDAAGARRASAPVRLTPVRLTPVRLTEEETP